MSAVWVVDDDQSIRWVLERALAREGFGVRSFSNARDALAAFAGDTPRVVVSDIRMPGESGIELLQQLKARRPGLPVIIMTAHSDLDSAVGAFQSGAFEYLPKPFDLAAAVELIRRAMLESEREAEVEDAAAEAPDMLGHAPAMQEVFRAIGRLSQSHVTVLITGESGSGKELVARALHRHSPRADKPFVALNTAAIPKDLLESELFGHERGAFTGAQQMRRGRFEQAEGGTLFLDEIGDMPSELQTRLLRVLSDGHFYRVGGHSPQKANVRVIAATHQNLEERVRQGLFREDLFHRLNVIRLRLPSLRERTEDIPLLARHFLSRSARELGVEAKRLTDGALAALMRFAWPGNVRQLENVCHWLTVMAPAQVIESKDLPPEVRDATASHAALAARGDDIRTPGSEAPSAFAGHADGAARHLEGASPGEATIASAVGLRTGGAPLAGFPSGVVNGTDPSGAAAATGGAFGLGAGMGATAAGGRGAVSASAWANLLERDVAALLAQQPYEIDAHSELMDRLSREFESAVIRTALRHTRGRRIEAAQRLGIGRNTITRKIAELKLED